MNAPFLCIALIISSGSPTPDQVDSYQKLNKEAVHTAKQLEVKRPIPVYRRLSHPDTVFRGQNPTYDELPDSGASGGGFDTSPGAFGAGGISGGNSGGTYTPAPLTQDPFLGGANPAPYVGPGNPYPGGSTGMFTFGANGPQPYRMGWSQRYDFGYLFGQSVGGNPGLSGDMSVFEFDADWEYTTPLSGGWIFSFTQEYDMRLWDGPLSAPGAAGLPSRAHRIGWDFKLATPQSGPWSMQFAFNPSLNSDFNQTVTSDAYNWDGRGILFYQASPQWMWAGGIGYWDRVNDQIIPYAGAVWTPSDIWEFRLIFPKPRISLFLGNIMGAATWAYTSLEYHIEAYEVELQPGLGRDKIQLEDWRLMGGIRRDYGFMQSFIEGGWIFNRDVAYLHGTPGFDISSGAIIRGGLRF